MIAATTTNIAATSITLINADTNKPVAGFDPLPNGATINLASLPTRDLNIRVNTAGAVESVKMTLDGSAISRTENGAPYALASDDNGDYAAWTPATGAHTLVATAYSGQRASGSASAPLTIAFTVVDQAEPLPATATPPPTQAPATATPEATPPPTQAPATHGAGTMVSVAPQAIAMAEPEIVNPMRGLYKWLGQETAPQPQPAYDAYDRYTWRDLEKGQGQYDFSLIERDAAQAQREGRKLGLRIRALATGRGPIQVPDYLKSQLEKGWSKDGVYVPDWNDPDFLSRAEALLHALGARYDTDPRISFIDIGIYGNWGEWHTSGFSYPSPTGAQQMTAANKQRVVDMHLAAFPHKFVVMLTDDAPTLVYALQQSPRVGWRRDSFGSTHFDSLARKVQALPNGAAAWELVSARWKTAPVIVEFINVRHPSRPSDPLAYYDLARQQAERYHVSLIGNGNSLAWDSLSAAGRAAFLQLGRTAGYRLELRGAQLPVRIARGGAVALATRWANVGVAPVYEPWQVTVQLRNQQTGAVVWEGASGLDLRQVPASDTAGTPATVVTQNDSLRLDAATPAGTYTLALIVRDPQGYRAPLGIAMRGRQADGSYTLGTVTVQ